MLPGLRIFAKMESEGPRVAPSRAKSRLNSPRIKMPLVVVANSPDKSAALAGLERWKARHATVVGFLAPEDVLVDSMRGRSSTWTRIRVNLQHVPENLRPAQDKPDPDDDPTREWSKGEMRKRKQKSKPT
jgi:bifunctional non-homologous end joining protein LigD